MLIGMTVKRAIMKDTLLLRFTSCTLNVRHCFSAYVVNHLLYVVNHFFFFCTAHSLGSHVIQSCVATSHMGMSTK
jgi:hypothetical protein